jgi:hypothetical protein
MKFKFKLEMKASTELDEILFSKQPGGGEMKQY